MPRKRNESINLALCDKIVAVLSKQMPRRETVRRTALNLVEIVFWARRVDKQLVQLGGMNAERVDDVGDLCSVLGAELLEIADHSRDAGRALERMLRSAARKEMRREARPPARRPCGRRGSGRQTRR